MDPPITKTMKIQAQNRIHRLGQTREVHYYDLIYKNTLEKEMLNVEKMDDGLFSQHVGNNF